MTSPPRMRSNGGVVVKLFFLAEQEVQGSIPGLDTTISEIGYLLLNFQWLKDR